MAEKYRAKRDGEVQEKTQEEINNENNANTIKNAADVAIATKNPYAVAAGAAVKVLDKATGGKSTEALGKVATQTFKRMPNGQQFQKLSNGLSESGVGDMIGSAASMKNGDASGAGSSLQKAGDASKAGDSLQKASNGVNKLNSNPSSNISSKVNNGNNVSNEVDSAEQDRAASEQSKEGSEWERTEKTNNKFAHQQFLKKKKFMIIGICGGFFFFIVMMTMIVSAKDFGNLDLTNKAKTIIGSGGARNCTTEELESGLVYVGDSRIVGMESSLNNENINYISEVGKGYSWLKDTASLELENTIQNNPDSVVVLGLGVNDLYNVDNYVAYYKDLMNKYPDNTFYVLSVNPVDDSLAAANGYSVTNSDIDAFNATLKSNFSKNYIDVNSSLSIGTSDGIHYDNDTNLNIHNTVVTSINQSGEVMCGAAGDLSVSLETVAMWYIENVNTYQKSKSGKGTGSRKYYATPFGSRKFGDDCTEFVAAYMSFISGTDIPESYSVGMVDPNGDWAKSVYSAGWKAYSSDEIDSLQFGDVLIAHAGALYSTQGQHGEIYINESQTFGWGSIKKTYPTSNTITRSVEGSHVHFRDANHDYITIYRFMGA